MNTITDTIHTPAIDALLRKAHALIAQELTEEHGWSEEHAERWHENRFRIDSLEREMYLRCLNILNVRESIATAKETAANAVGFLTDLDMVATQRDAEGDAEHLAIFHDDARQVAILLAADDDYLGEWEWQR